jgi:uncharacterized protein YjiK
MVSKQIVPALLQAMVIVVLFCGCDISKKKKFADSADYAISSPKVISLPEILDEISGIAYYAKDTSVFAIIDEDGILFKIPLKNPKGYRQWKFDKKRDFEELVLVDSTFYALVSNGDIETIKFGQDKIETTKSNFSEDSKAVNEFESMYWQDDSTGLVILCKSCDADPKKSFSSFKFNPRDTSKTYASHITFDMSALESKLNVDKHLKASAAAVHPITKDIYIISSIQKLLVITNSKGEFKELIQLDPGIYKQPEGLTFTPEGDLIISNEFANDGFANLLLLKYKKKGR